MSWEELSPSFPMLTSWHTQEKSLKRDGSSEQGDIYQASALQTSGANSFNAPDHSFGMFEMGSRGSCISLDQIP